MEQLKSTTNYLIVIIGATAIGKTALSIKLANHFNCAIVSCDSRQFFKEMTIGTAVPSKEELAQAPHYFIQNKSITEDYNVGDYEKEALALLDELFMQNHIQIVVGGSGLYVDAILKGFDDFPEVSNEIKAKIDQNYNTHGFEYLQKTLQQLDPDYFHFLNENNPQTLQNQQRMKRFIGVSIAAQAPYSSFLNQPKKARNFVPIVIGLEAPREIMYQRINQRVDAMMQNGLLHEVAGLKEYQQLNALQTVGYRELFDFFDEKISLNDAIEEIKKNTRRFAKRQLTWFKRNEDAKWFSYQESVQKIIKHIHAITQ
ncbi:tRNA (adenosine(37)-N6)-dimethylallyltransferase MiaA [Paenimyroides aestuarii]|uniref:tRNA dimethylallyltransferase n=1 Tax=Paenimyroides aestuarii TaxID=2968490 RepID=A0ABY5NR00_9FLAO|nr:tRNA (adenosine(37)-N6)-dimethylallyltransferase MiaA [Paenimyroides aestuarii]UUV20951.1 tRNA (adenosine(37)-N6)-dimethylallyltransferase MiaA [Paenimyroides aestuarii]